MIVTAWRVFLVSLATLVAVVAGLGAILGTARVSDKPPLFLLAGLLAFCTIYSLALLFFTRNVGATGRRRARLMLFGVGAALVVAFALAALNPMDDSRLPLEPVTGQQFWKLSTGSAIDHVHIPAEGEARQTPVLFLHGGPGVPDLQGDSEYFGRLTADGYDVYVYDEVGSGGSSRLEDPRGYTLERDVTDLEAIRQKIGAERVILIGHSYGGTLAAAYAASHPEHVTKMVLSSPGDPSPSAGGASMLGRLSTREKLGIYALLLPPRPMLAYALLQVNPEAAHDFAGDAEMDARFDRVYNRTRPALHCEDKPPGPRLHALGFYANQYPQSAARSPHADFMLVLARLDVPTLVIKGSCDYLSWSSAVNYLRTLPDSRLVYLQGAGHNTYQDRPEKFSDNLRSFLNDESLPQERRQWGHPPEGYEGPQ